MKKPFFVLFFFCVIVFTGCASTVNNLKPDEVLTDKNNYGYIYGSCKRPFLGLPQEIISPDLHLFIETKNREGGTEKFKLEFTTEKMNKKGLFVFKINPGDYTLYEASIDNYSKTFKNDFSVKEGGVYYLGFINFHRGLLNFLGSSISVNITNDEEYDKTKLIEDYPALSEMTFQNLTKKK